MGASDMVSVVIRLSLVQLDTPDEMRGRVSAVNSLCTGTSNHLGQFRSGLTADWFGVVPSVVIGGIGTLVDRGALDALVSRPGAQAVAAELAELSAMRSEARAMARLSGS